MLLGDDEVREMALDHVSTWAGWQVGRAGMGWEQGMLLPSGSGLLSRLVKTRKARASGQARPGKGKQAGDSAPPHCVAHCRLLALH